MTSERIAEARRRLEADEPEAALRELAAIETEELDAEGWITVGDLFAQADRRDAAREAGRRAQALAPRDRRALALVTLPYRVDGVDHHVPLIGANAANWNRLGVIAVVLGLSATILLRVAPPFAPPDMAAKDPLAAIRPYGTTAAFLTVAYYLATAALAGSWLIFDLLDRRARLAWMVLVPVLCVCGLGWLPTALYLGMRRLSSTRA